MTEGVLWDKEIFNLVSIALVSLHFALSVVQQTCQFLTWSDATLNEPNGDNPLTTESWPASYFSLHYQPWIKQEGHKGKGNDHQLKKLSIAKQIILVYIEQYGECTLWFLGVEG